jgi:hypothetical protein
MCAAGASPMGAPYYKSQITVRGSISKRTGCPLLAFPTTSAARVLMVFMQTSSAGKGEKVVIVSCFVVKVDVRDRY